MERAIMTRPEGLTAAYDEMDRAIVAYVSIAHPGFTTGWVLAAASISETKDGTGTYYVNARSTDLPFHGALGLHHNAIHDMHWEAKDE